LNLLQQVLGVHSLSFQLEDDRLVSKKIRILRYDRCGLIQQLQRLLIPVVLDQKQRRPKIQIASRGRRWNAVFSESTAFSNRPNASWI